jgi:DNA-binding transcriptional regulator LsrR (DeoR family)
VGRRRKSPDRDFLIELAKLYYEKDRSQMEIAKQFGISRSLVCNLLGRCRAEGIVEIRVIDSSSAILRLQRELLARFSLRYLTVVPSSPDPEQAKVHVGKAAATLIEPLLKDHARIGISWGTTLYQLVEQVTPKTLKGVEVVQLHGGLGAKNPDIDGFGLARKLSEKLGGTYRIIQAPITVKTVSLKKMLIQEPNISKSLLAGASADIALFGIGSNVPAINALVRAGYLSKDESLALLKNGSVGSVCGLHINAKGECFPSAMNDRTIGIDLKTLLRIPVRLGIAAGEKKAEAVMAAIRGQFVNSLVVDEEIATALLHLP